MRNRQFSHDGYVPVCPVCPVGVDAQPQGSIEQPELRPEPTAGSRVPRRFLVCSSLHLCPCTGVWITMGTVRRLLISFLAVLFQVFLRRTLGFEAQLEPSIGSCLPRRFSLVWFSPMYRRMKHGRSGGLVTEPRANSSRVALVYVVRTMSDWNHTVVTEIVQVLLRLSFPVRPGGVGCDWNRALVPDFRVICTFGLRLIYEAWKKGCNRVLRPELPPVFLFSGSHCLYPGA